MTRKLHTGRSGTLPFTGALFAASVVLGGCNLTSPDIVTGTVPDDYRLRHPIAVTEGEQSIVIFVGRNRGNMTETQRDDVAGMARRWAREGTGGFIADVPSEGPNARAASAIYQEIRGMLTQRGVPGHAITKRPYQSDDPRDLATIRLSFPRMKAVAGPCGTWPADLGPSIYDPAYNENKPYYNFGCATQRNIAAMVENPSDLEQPRSETPAYQPRRDIAFDRYRKGNPTTTTYPEVDKAKLSDTGK